MNKITFARVSGYDAAIAAASTADVHVIAPTGELDEAALVALCDEMVSLSCVGKQNLVLDLASVSYVDYRGVRLLAARAAFLRRSGGDLKVCGLSHYLMAVFRASGLADEFEFFEDAPKAAADFAVELGLP